MHYYDAGNYFPQQGYDRASCNGRDVICFNAKYRLIYMYFKLIYCLFKC